MDLQAIATMFHTVANSVAGGAAMMVVFIGIIGYMKYSASKDRTKHGRQVFKEENL